MERKIRGLEDHETQERKRLFRDVRSPLQRLGDTLRLGHVQTGGIFAAGVCLFLFPSLSMPFFIAGLALFAARCVYVEDERLPFRMPLGLSGTDKGDPLPGRRGYARPEGIFFLGNRVQDQKELWLKAKDILTHCLLFGTTGSGKTETLVSLSYNALATGSGLFYIDPKASPKLAVQIWQMARFLGRDDDFRVLNYGTSGKVKGKTPRRLSNTNNPFTFGSAEALTQLLVSLMPASDGANSIFADKAQALISGVMYALVDLRDKGLLKLSTSVIRESLALEKCVALALRAELDEESRASIHAALGTCGWIAGREMKDQPQSFAEQFGYAQSYFGKALSSLTDTYSHIYGAEDGEVDFADAIMQRRVLVVLLPSLEKAPAELASLGKISLSAIRNACAVGLGAHIEGDAADVLEALPTDTVGIGPYLCIVDEYAAIVTPGFEVVLTQARSRHSRHRRLPGLRRYSGSGQKRRAADGGQHLHKNLHENAGRGKNLGTHTGTGRTRHRPPHHRLQRQRKNKRRLPRRHEHHRGTGRPRRPARLAGTDRRRSPFHLQRANRPGHHVLCQPFPEKSAAARPPACAALPGETL